MNVHSPQTRKLLWLNESDTCLLTTLKVQSFLDCLWSNLICHLVNMIINKDPISFQDRLVLRSIQYIMIVGF